jgi:transcriptional regulator with AAA-type ATPase domain
LLPLVPGVNSEANSSTLRLEETGHTASRADVQVVRWVSAGARRLYTQLASNCISIGRDENADVCLQAAGVSRHHADFVRQGPVYAIRDCGSTNGTYVNGVRVEHGALSPGDVLRLGDVIGVVARVDADFDPTSPDVLDEVPEVVFGPGLFVQLGAIRRAAPSDLPVVIVGETGSGKEFIAKAIHALSKRPGELHAVNCAALPTALAEAELFGYRKGAFTGAERPAVGHVRAADGGTLFLDELAELPLPIQAKLLRVLQDKQVTSLGETRPVNVSVRFVAAVQVPISTLVAQQRVREDLAMRLNGLVVELPPLRARRVDIAVLLSHFLRQHSGGRPPALETRLVEDLLLYSWPGNVRELELTVRKLLILHGHEPKLRRHMLPSSMRNTTSAFGPERIRDRAIDAGNSGATASNRREHEFSKLVRELKNNGNNLTRAAVAIGVSRQRAYRLLGGKSVAEVVAASPDEAPQSGHEG